MLKQILCVVFVSVALASSSTLANSLSLGPITQAALDSVGSSSGLAGYLVVSSIQSYVNQIEAHSQNIRQNLNILRSNTTNKALLWLFTPLSQMEQKIGSLTASTKSLSNAGSALSSLHLMTTDPSQGLSSLAKSSSSIAAAFLNAPANVASRVLSSGINTINNIAATSASAATQYQGHPTISAGLGAFNRQLGRQSGALNALQNLTDSWSGYDSQVLQSIQNLVKGDLASWASASYASANPPTKDALSSLQLFSTHLNA